MSETLSRRRFLGAAPLVVPMIATSLESESNLTRETAPLTTKNSAGFPDLADIFPTQPPELVREMVLVSHFNLGRVKELVQARPTLAKAAWDWGFGDWETALGAAAHMGNRPIAEFLIANGAHSSIFSATMLGHLDVVKAFITAQPGIQRTAGPHSISLLAHAKAGGDAARQVLEFLQTLGDADGKSETPMSDQDRAAILGTYMFGPGPTQRIDVAVEKGRLTWTRKGTMGRWLFYVGEQAFYPAGAPAVRIRFSEEAEIKVMTVTDPNVVLVARRE